MFPNYGARGDAFAAAVRALAGRAERHHLGDTGCDSPDAEVLRGPPGGGPDGGGPDGQGRTMTRDAGTAWRVPAADPRERLAAWSALLGRPLLSYYLVVGIASLLLALGLVMVLSTSSASALVSGEPPYREFQKQLLGVALGLPLMWFAARSSPRLLRAAAYPLLVVSVLGLLLTLHPRRRGGLRRRLPLDPARPVPVAAVRAGQAHLRAVGGGPAGQEGEARPAHRLAAAAGAAAARRGSAQHARHARRRPGHHVRAADHLPGPAVGHRHAGPAMSGHARPDGPGHAHADHRRTRTSCSASPTS